MILLHAMKLPILASGNGPIRRGIRNTRAGWLLNRTDPDPVTLYSTESEPYL